MPLSMPVVRREDHGSAPDSGVLEFKPADVSFPKQQRLLNSTAFKQVFKKREKISRKYGGLYLARNDLYFCRLGITVSKKVSRKAVQRNRIKRLVREYFRHNQKLLSGYDVIFNAYPGCADLSNSEFNRLLDTLWQRAVAQCAR